MKTNQNTDEKNINERRFTFGKYKGRLISNIIIIDSKYVKWAVKQNLIKLPKWLKL